MKKSVSIAVLAVLLTGCDRQRDLYTKATPLLEIEGDWVPSLGIEDMSRRATAMLYELNGSLASKEIFSLQNRVTAEVSTGEYGVLIFNGMMFSEQETNLEQIYFRNTERAETFEAYAAPAVSGDSPESAADEYVAGNGMEVLTSAYCEVRVKGDRMYYLKYHNGHNGYPTVEDYVDSVVRMVPRPLSHYAKVVVHLTNPGSASAAEGTLHGFSGSVFVLSGMPSHDRVAHRLKLNNLHIDPGSGQKSGTIESPLFVTFGPPINLRDDTEWKYEFDISLSLKDGETMTRTFDVAPQILPVIERIRERTFESSPSDPILIEIWLELPDTGSSVGVDDWVDGEVIVVPIH